MNKQKSVVCKRVIKLGKFQRVRALINTLRGKVKISTKGNDGLYSKVTANPWQLIQI